MFSQTKLSARQLLASVAILLAVNAPCLGSDLDTGVKAYQAKDYASAFTHFKRLAEQGNAAAQFNLGVMYQDGHGVKQNFTAAVGWYQKSSAQGDSSAQLNLGLLYYEGRGVTKNLPESAK